MLLLLAQVSASVSSGPLQQPDVEFEKAVEMLSHLKIVLINTVGQRLVATPIVF